jgi:hypothetical protein
MTYDDMDLHADEFDADTINEIGIFEMRSAWDCDPDTLVSVDEYDAGLDETDDTGDWQVLALDRFGDRNVNPNF